MIPYQSSIGIEIREDSMILVHLMRTLRETKVQNSLILPFSPPLSPESEAEVIDSIKRFLGHNRIRPERVVVGIPRGAVILKYLAIPSLKKENIPQILEYEIEKHLPFKPEEVYYDFGIVEKGGENLYNIFLVAVKKEIIDYIKDLFERVPLMPKIFDLSSFGIFNALGFSKRFSEDKIDAILFLGSKEVELEMVQDGLLRFSRSLPMEDGDNLIERIATELENAISGIDTKGKEKKINKVILSGPGALRPDLIESIKEKVSVNAEIETLSGKVASRPMEPKDRYSLIPAIGLALRGLGEAELRINLLPHEQEVGIGKRGRNIAIILTGIVIFLGLAGIVSSAIKDNIEIKGLKKRIETLKPQAVVIEKIQADIKKIEDKKGLIDKIKSEDLSKLDILSELTRVIPADAWIVSLDYTETLEQKTGKDINGKIKREIIISGFATSASKLIPLLEESPFFDNVEFAGPITSGVDGKERFRIKALSKKVVLSPGLIQEKPEITKEGTPKKEVQKKEGQKKEAIKEEPLGPTESTENQSQPRPPRFIGR